MKKDMKMFVLLIAIGLFWFTPPVSAAAYADAVPVLEQMGASLEIFVTDMEKADSGEAAAKALDGYTNAMKPLVPKLKELIKKYPELADQKTHPEELKPRLKKIEELTKKMFGLFAKLKQWAGDPAVDAANKRFQEAMAAMR